MSDTPGSTQDLPGSHGNGRYVSKPDLYHGDRIKLDEWLLQFDLFFDFQGQNIEEVKKVSLATTYMRGTALQWIKPHIKKYMDGDAEEDLTVWMEDFSEFKSHIRQVFGTAGEISNAGRAIQRLQQRRSAAEYATTFQQHAVLLDWDDNALTTMFRQGLKQTVKAELMRTGASTETLKDLIDVSIDIDNKLFELGTESRQDSTPRANYGQSNRAPIVKPWKPYVSNPRSRSRQRGYKPSNNWHDPDAMQIDTVTKGRGDHRKTNDKFSTDTRSCYNCGRIGHISRNCKAPKKRPQQLNVLTHPHGVDEGDDDEWQIVTAHVGRLMIDTGEDSPASTTEEEFQSEDEEPPIKRTKVMEDERPRTPYPVRAKRSTKRKDSVGNEQDTADEENEVWTYLSEQLKDFPDVLDALKNSKNNRSPIDDEELEEPPILELTPSRRQRAEERTRLQEKLYAKQTNWVDEEKTRSQRRMARQRSPNEETSTRPQYKLDYRNALHETMSWTACAHDDCAIHYSDKIGAGWFPATRATCNWQWFECTNNSCETHLWDKRERKHFPGTENPAEILQMQMLINGACNQFGWQTCLHSDCFLHWTAKKINGYGTQTFLGQHLAPGTDPAAALPPTRHI